MEKEIEKMKWQVTKENLRLTLAMAKESMTAYEIADVMRQAFDDEEINNIIENIHLKKRF